MKTIKIIRGNYGWHPGGGRGVRPVSQGATVEVDDAEAERLIQMKVGVPVTVEVTAKDTSSSANAPLSPEGEGGEEEPAEDDGVVLPKKKK